MTMLHDLPRSAAIGGYSFPTRADYLAHCGHDRPIDELDPATVVAIQRDWHMRGQNGCVFAMHAARHLSPQQWRCEVEPRTASKVVVRHTIEAAIANPENLILSLIFPTIECLDDIRCLVTFAESVGCYEAKENSAGSGYVCLRYPVGEAEAWIVGFAPLSTLPPTRRAPFAELAIRTKTKIGAVHPELNNETDQAHLADVDLHFPTDVMSSLISKSKTRSVKILGGPLARSQAKGAKAKVTYDLSSSLNRQQELN